MLDRMIKTKQEQVKNNLANYTQGKYEPPKLDLDIYFLSPKIVIHESLLSSRVVNPDEMTSFVVDLGKIEVTTKLVPKKRGLDYREVTDPEQLYDTIAVKFGQVKISADFNMRLHQHAASNKSLGWSFSPYKVDVTNDISLGLLLKTCMTPFHPAFPSQVINAKVEPIVLSVSRAVAKAGIKLGAVYQHSDFAKALADYLKEGETPPPPVIVEEAQTSMDTLQVEGSQKVPSLKIEVNFVISKIMV